MRTRFVSLILGYALLEDISALWIVLYACDSTGHVRNAARSSTLQAPSPHT